MEGHLKIVWLKEVELAGARSWKVMSGNYAEYPLSSLAETERKKSGESPRTATEIIGLRCQWTITFWMLGGGRPGRKSLRLRKRILDATARKRMSANIILNPGLGAISVPN